MSRPARWVKYSSVAFAGILAVLGLIVVAYGAYLATFLALPKSDEHPPLRLYSGPFLLQPDLSLGHSHLLERLQRLGYRRVNVPVQTPGDWRWGRDASLATPVIPAKAGIHLAGQSQHGFPPARE